MGKRFKRSLLLGPMFGAVALAMGVGTAYACTNLASLNLGTPSGAAGSNVAVTGSSFAAGSPVDLHWNSVTGTPLATVTPDASGSISASLTVPADAQPGSFVVVATEQGPKGPAFGTPARASFTVTNAGATAAPAVAPSQANSLASPAPATSGISGGLIGLTVALGVVGLGLFGFGAVGYGRQRRKAPATAPSKANK